MIIAQHTKDEDNKLAAMHIGKATKWRESTVLSFEHVTSRIQEPQENFTPDKFFFKKYGASLRLRTCRRH
jgi:hypothetical protein